MPRVEQLPVNPGQRKRHEPPSVEGVNIVVVDDDPRVRGLYAVVLREAGAIVTASGTAAEAIYLANLEPNDVVITDLRMPEHDGIWLLQQLKAHRPAPQRCWR